MILLQGLTTFYNIRQMDKKSGQTIVFQQFAHFSYFILAAELGFEPRQTESESVVLPLHNSASARDIIVYHQELVKHFLKFFTSPSLPNLPRISSMKGSFLILSNVF